jgi:hypothetical protein
MSALMKSVCASCLLLIGCLGTSMVAQSGLVFEDGWDNGVGTGCDQTKITDNRAWNDFGPSSTCSGNPPVAEIVSDERFEGTSSLRVNFRPDGTANGPDFRIVKAFGTNYNQIYARWYIKYSNNWVFASADHKVAIFGVNDQQTQDVYYNVRGNGGGGPNGRVVIYLTRTDSIYSDPSVAMTPGVWHLCEVHIVSGPNGLVEAKLDGRLLNLQYEAGNQVNLRNTNTGAGLGYLKLDTTYNAYSYPSSQGLYMNTWYDSVVVSTAGWIGGTPAGGGGPTQPALNPPAPPSGLQIIR